MRLPLHRDLPLPLVDLVLEEGANWGQQVWIEPQRSVESCASQEADATHGRGTEGVAAEGLDC